MSRLKLYVGKLDSMRFGAVVANNQKAAAKAAGITLYEFRQYWETSFRGPGGVEFKPLTLYTRRYGEFGVWSEGRCSIAVRKVE